MTKSKKENPDETIQEKEEEKKQAGVEDLYADEEPITFMIKNVEFKVREVPGSEMLEIIDKCTKGANVDRKKYLVELWKACGEEPKDLDVGKLRTSHMTILLTKLEEIHGMLEVVPGNLMKELQAGT